MEKREIMGYTNYWRRPCELPAAPFATAVTDCQAVIGRMDVELAGFDGDGQPLFASDHLVFNGRNPQSCEPFEVARTQFDRQGRLNVLCYCKTEQLPYDLCVKVALVILSHYLRELIACSDGREDDWTTAKGIVQAQLNYGQDFVPQPE